MSKKVTTEKTTTQSIKNIVSIQDVHKDFTVGEQQISVLKDINISIKSGDFLVVVGASGSGKSTILHTLLGLEPPSSGTVKFLDKDLYHDTTEDYRSDLRKQHVGTVYQQANWIKALTVRENVAFPMMILGAPRQEALQKADELLAQIQMDQWAHYTPTELSAGQQQRVALARALINDPQLIVADEPTGNLDYENGQNVMRLFKEMNDRGKTVVMVTHDLEYLSFAKTAVHIFDGQISGVYTDEGQKKLLSKIRSKKGSEIKKEIANDAKGEQSKSVHSRMKRSEHSTASSQHHTAQHLNKKKQGRFRLVPFSARSIVRIPQKLMTANYREIFRNIKDSFVHYTSFNVLLATYLLFKLSEFLKNVSFFPTFYKEKLFPRIQRLFAKITDNSDGKKDTINKINLIDLSLKNMFHKKARAFITIGGMSVGIAAIVFLVSIGYGLQELVIRRVASLNELKQIDVATQVGSNNKITDETIASIDSFNGVNDTLPIISVVGRINFQSSVTDAVVFGVTQKYLHETQNTLVSGEYFESNDVVLQYDSKGDRITSNSIDTDQEFSNFQTATEGQEEIEGDVAGVSTEKTVAYGDKIAEIDFNIEPGRWVRVRSGPSTSDAVIGYTRRVEGTLQGNEVFGATYLDNENGNQVGGSTGRRYGKWVEAEVVLWEESNECGESVECEDGVYKKLIDDLGSQVQQQGYFAEIGLTNVDTYNVVAGEVLGVSTQAVADEEGQVLAVSDSTDDEPLADVATASAGIVQLEDGFVELLSESEASATTKATSVDLTQDAHKRAVLNQALVEVLGLTPDEIIGQTIEVSFVVTGDLLEDRSKKIESVAAAYEVVGVVSDNESPFFYVPFIDLRSLGVTNYSQLKVLVSNPDQVDIARKQIESSGYATFSVQDTVDQIDRLFATARIILASIGFVALAVAALGMFNTMSVSLLERTREVGLMKAMGMRSNEVKELFLTESMIMGFFGGVIGISMGVAGGLLVSLVLSTLSLAKGVGFLNVSYLPGFFVIFIVVLSIFVSFVTGIYPARRATKISALNALRYE